MGLLLAVVVHPANIQDRDGARLVIDKLIGRFPRLRLIWADAGYSGQLVDWVMSMSGWVLEIVKRPRASHQFEVLPRRWVVERTLAWLGRCRRLSKDYEALTGTTEAWLHIAAIHLIAHYSSRKRFSRISGVSPRPSAALPVSSITDCSVPPCLAVSSCSRRLRRSCIFCCSPGEASAKALAAAASTSMVMFAVPTMLTPLV